MLCLLLSLCCMKAAMAAQTKPHIILIMADDLGWNDIGYHGSDINTPNLDTLAAIGVELTQHYVAPNCGPSRSQFLTGRYLTHLGLQHRNLSPCRPSGVPLHVPTIADELAKVGYKNHLIGKWHAGYHTAEYLPTNRGFHTFRGMLRGQGDHYQHASSFNGKMALDFYNDTEPYTGANGTYSTEYFKNRAVELINEHNRTGDPMFMFLSFQAPHQPAQAPQKYIDMYADMPFVGRQNYAAMVTAMDSAIGDIVYELMVNEMFDNTVIVFMSDNGGQALSSGASNFPYRGNKGTYYEAGIKSAAFVSSSLLKRTGKVHDLIHITDWMPTFIHLAGGKPLTGIDGVNQWPTLSNGAPSQRNEIIFNIDPLSISDRKLKRFRTRLNRRLNDVHDYSNVFSSTTTELPVGEIIPEFTTDQLSAIRYGDWKMITGEIGYNRIIPNPITEIYRYLNVNKRKSRRSAIRLYNITADPTESVNLASQNQPVVNFLVDKLKAHQETATAVWYPEASPACRPKLRQGGIIAWGPYMEPLVLPNPNSTRNGSSTKRTTPSNIPRTTTADLRLRNTFPTWSPPEQSTENQFPVWSPPIRTTRDPFLRPQVAIEASAFVPNPDPFLNDGFFSF